MSTNTHSNEDLKMSIPMKAPMKAPMKTQVKKQTKKQPKKEEETKPKRNLTKDDFDDAETGYCISLTNQLGYLYYKAVIVGNGEDEEANAELERKKKTLTKFITSLKKPGFDLDAFRKKMWLAEMVAEAKAEKAKDDN